MEETYSELTKISNLPKRQRFQIDESFQMTSRTQDKSFTEISDVSDLSVFKTHKSTFFQANFSNDKLEISMKRSLDEIDILVQSVENVTQVKYDSKTSTDIKYVVTYDADENVDVLNGEEIQLKSVLFDGSQNEIINDDEIKDDVDKPNLMDMKFKSSSQDVLDVESLFSKSTILPLISEVRKEEKIEIVSETKAVSKRKTSLINNLIEEMKIKKQLTDENNALENKLVEYFRRRRPDAARKVKQQLQEREDRILDKEERYSKYLVTIRDLQMTHFNSLQEIESDQNIKLEEIAEKEKIILDTKEEFVKFRHQIASTAANSNTGKRIPTQDLEAFYASESNKDATVYLVRLENIKLQNTVKGLRKKLTAKESLTDKLNLVDFEQFKIENQTYNGKLEERNDSISRLNDKIVSHIHMITHMKEKLQNTSKEFKHENKKLQHASDKFNGARRKLRQKKYIRDDVLTLNKKLAKSGGLLHSPDLLIHFKRTADAMELQKGRFDILVNDCNILVHKNRELKQRLNQIDSFAS